MNKKINLSAEGNFAGQKVSLRTGNFAMLADAAVMAQVGDTTVLVSVVSRPSQDATDFLPLRVDYEERYYAGGLLSGSRFTRREGKPTDKAIVDGRLIDHAIRPLFPKDFTDDTQVVITVLSVDNVNSPILVGFLAVSAALSLSGVPFSGPIVPLRISKVGEEITYDLSMEKENSVMDLVVSYLDNGKKIQALEAHGDIIPEQTIVDSIKQGAKEVAPLFELLHDFVSKGNVTVKSYKKSWLSDDLKNTFKDDVLNEITAMSSEGILYTDGEWNIRMNALAEKIGKNHLETGELNIGQLIIIIAEIQKDWVRDMVVKKNSRIDGRGDDEIRPLSAEIAILPRVHGSALFSRGLSQALSIATLGPVTEKLVIQSMHGEQKKRYIHHYNFPPYSTGETGRVGGSNRREIGHGMLAEKALVPVLPSEDEFPYTIRVVSEILTSNGSTSMASTCGSSLSLMDAGVPIKSHVAGIGVGLFITSKSEEPKLEDYKLLTDILGFEDFAGYMDFKLTGTREGMTAIQLELKLKGIPLELLDSMFESSRVARMKVLDVMEATIKEPRKELGKYVPKIDTVKIAKDQIGLIIGSGGATVRGLMEQTNTQIDVDETPEGGIVSIMAATFEDLNKAKDLIAKMTREIKVGEAYEGVITRIEPYGFFVELGPKQEGLVHVSEYSYEFVDDITTKVKLGDIVTAKVKAIENGKISLSTKMMEEKPEGYVERERPARSFDKPRSSGGYNNNRGSRPSYDRSGGGSHRGGGGYPRERY